MNAIPQRTHQYKKLQLPVYTYRPQTAQNIEYLDAHRAAKLETVRQRERAHKEAEEIRMLEEYYSRSYHEREAVQPREDGRRKVGQTAPSGRKQPKANKKAGRKITAAYEVKPGPKPYVFGNGQAALQANAAGSMAISRPAQDVRSRQVAVEEKAPRRRGVPSTIITIVLVFMMLAGVLTMQAKISDVTYQNAQTENRISELQRELDKKYMDKALKEDLSSIQQRAAAKGMAHPTDNQIVFVPAEADLPSQHQPRPEVTNNAGETGSVTASEDANAISVNQEGESESVLGSVGGFFTKVVDTIKGWIEKS